MFKKALVGVDGTESSLKAVVAAKELLEKGVFEEVTLLSVIAPASSVGVAEAVIYIPQVSENLFENAKRVLEDTLAATGDHEKINTHIEAGIPGDVIIGMAKRDGYDAILVGSRGFSGVKRLFLGSVSTQVVQSAECPVFVIR